MDTIKTTLELNGITMTCPGAGCMVCFGYKQGPTPDTYNCKYMKTPLDNSVFDVPFYIECKDDPSKLHKFCEMKYCGLVDNPHHQKVGDLLREMVKKFDGCIVAFDQDRAYLIAKKVSVHLGCSIGVAELIGKILIGLGDPLTGPAIALNRIDASKIPSVWSWALTYEKEIRVMCEQLKDVEP